MKTLRYAIVAMLPFSQCQQFENSQSNNFDFNQWDAYQTHRVNYNNQGGAYTNDQYNDYINYWNHYYGFANWEQQQGYADCGCCQQPPPPVYHCDCPIYTPPPIPTPTPLPTAAPSQSPTLSPTGAIMKLPSKLVQ
jgi:hypothetical protein